MSTPPTSTPLEDFFAQFADLGFTYHQDKTAHKNFERLHKISGWDKKSDEWVYARIGFNDALGKQFNFIFGTVNNLESWQKLCSFINITPVPDDITDCRKHLQDAHVNIVDILECARSGERVRTFATLKELKKYSINHKKIFPRQSASAGGLVEDLLREIFGPGGKRSGGKKRRRRKARKQAAAAQ